MLIERERQLEELSRALTRATAGHGALACVEGPAGIGKSALLDALRERAGDVPVHSARGSELGRDFAFGVVRELLGRVVDEAGSSIMSGMAAAAGPVFTAGGADPMRTDRGPLLHALWWLVADLAEQAPRLLLVDDAQWCDKPSLDLLRHLQPRLGELPVLIVVAARPEGRALDSIAARGSPALALPPLSQEGVCELVGRVLGREPDPGFVDACHTATGGNPFLVSELLGDLRGDGVEPDAAGAALVNSIRPDSIARAVLVRLVQQGPEAVRLARAAAVLGACRLAHAAALGRVSAPAAVASVLMHQGVLANRRPLEFVHPIVRTVVYEDMTSAERGEAHARAADLLAHDGAPIEQVASHLLEAEPAGNQLAVERLAAAAAEARTRGAPEVAARFLRRALEEPARGNRARLELELELGRAEALAGAEGGGLDFLRAGLAGQPPGRRFAEVARELAQACVPLRRFEEAIAVLQTAVAQLPACERELALELEGLMASAGRLNQSTCEEAADRLERVAEDVRGETPAERALHATLAATRLFQARPAGDAIALVRRAFEGGLLAEQADSLPVIDGLYVWVTCGEPGEARRVCDELLEGARARGSLRGIAGALFMRSMLAYRHGDIHDAEVDGRAALAASEHGRFARSAIAVACLCDALLERGRTVEAVELLEARDAGGALEPDFPSTLLLQSRARLRLAIGDIEAGLADLRELDQRRAYTLNPAMFAHRSLLAIALAGLGARDQAIAAAQEELELARVVGLPRVIGRAQRALAIAQDDERGLRDAVATLSETDAPLEHARALVDLGALLRRHGSPAEAREPLREGGTLAHACGATALQERAREELAATGVRRVSRLLASGVEGLTPSELRVARMASEGMTNRAIAQALFVTPKTVEVHLGQVYRKLGIASRSDLGAALDAPR